MQSAPTTLSRATATTVPTSHAPPGPVLPPDRPGSRTGWACTAAHPVRPEPPRLTWPAREGAQPTRHARLVAESPPEPSTTYPNVALSPGSSDPFQSTSWTITLCPP